MLKLLHCVYKTDPAVGGSFEAVRQFCLAHRQMGHEVELASLDLPDAPHLREMSIPVHALGQTVAKYGFSPDYAPWLRENHSRFDAVIVNGLWQYHSYATWKVLRGSSTPYFAFPHGMLDPWFKRTYPLKHLKKWLYWPWADYRVLRDARAALFTCEEERERAQESFWWYRCRSRIAPLGVAESTGDPQAERDAFLRQYPFLADQPFLLFLGRIHEIKGCENLLDAFGRIAKKEKNLVLVMAGPGDEAYLNTLRTRCESYGKEIASRVIWTGMLKGPLKWGAFHAAEAFILPSHSENFGIAVAEALACGRPALITQKVGIWKEIVEDDAGWAERDDSEGVHRLIERWLKLSPPKKQAMSVRARACFDCRFEIRHAAQSLLNILEDSISNFG